MTTYYVGPGGHDTNNGESWARRKLTLNGAEDIPVVAGDTVYVGPGVYRETLTVDVSGNAGNIITYIADVTGENTDGVGGLVRITGSDNDQTDARGSCISAHNRDYRTFRGFAIDTSTNRLIDGGNCDHITIEDCSFQTDGICIYIDALGTDWTIRRCVFLLSGMFTIRIVHTSEQDDSNHLIENCVFLAALGDHIRIDYVGDGTIRNCTFLCAEDDIIDVNTSPNAGHGWNVNNCLFSSAGGSALEAAALGDIVEDYNNFYCNAADRTNVNVGANSVAYAPLLLPPLLYAGATQDSGFRFPWWLGSLSEWSQVAHIAGTSEPDTDLHGIVRPSAAVDKSWGACQFQDVERDTQITRGGSEASLVVHEPGRVQMWVPTTDVQTTISTYVYRLAGYSSLTNPQMIIKQPGQTDRVTTDAAAASQWNLLTDTFTPAADPPYVVVELVSNEGVTSTSTSTTSTSTSTTSTSTSITSTSTSITSTSTSVTSTSTSTTSTSHSTSTTTLAFNVYFDDLSVS